MRPHFHTLLRSAIRAALALLVIGSLPRWAAAGDGWGVEFGMNWTRLSGELRDVAPSGLWSPLMGIEYRLPIAHGFRVRTGVEYVRRGGKLEGRRLVLQIADSSGAPFDSLTILSGLVERWSPSWIELPVGLERSFAERSLAGTRRLGGYVGIGLAPAVRISETHRDTFAPPSDPRVRRFDLVARAALGVELHDGNGVVRFEVRGNGGLLKLLPDDGAANGQAWGVASVITISP